MEGSFHHRNLPYCGMNCVPSKKVYPNPWHLWLWPYLGIWCLQMYLRCILMTIPGIQWLRISLPMQGQGFNPWSWKIPQAMEQRSPHASSTELMLRSSCLGCCNKTMAPYRRGFAGDSVAKSLPDYAGDEGDAGSIPGSGRSPREEMATYSSVLTWEIPGTEKPGELQSIASQRVRHDWVTEHAHTLSLRVWFTRQCSEKWTVQITFKYMSEEERLFSVGSGGGVSETYSFKGALGKVCETGHCIGKGLLKIQATSKRSQFIAMAETAGQLPALPKQFGSFEAYPWRGSDRRIRRGVLSEGHPTFAQLKHTALKGNIIKGQHQRFHGSGTGY